MPPFPDRLHVRGPADARLPLRLLNLLEVQGIQVRDMRLTTQDDSCEVNIDVIDCAPRKRELILERVCAQVLVAEAFWR